LGDDERRRLHAHFTRVITTPPTPASLRKHVSLLPADLRQDAGDLLLAVARADGSVDRAEATRVNRYFDALGLERPELRSQPKPPATESLTPMRTAGTPQPDYVIPRASPAENPGGVRIVLDPELIRSRMAETERASSLLAEIFTGEDTSSFTALDDPMATQTPPGESQGAPVLDELHRSFLMRLAERESWPRSEVDGLAAELGLMPDGALEIVNEAAFDAVHEAACEVGDPVEVNIEVVREMLK
jgi:hypothetical protein